MQAKISRSFKIIIFVAITTTMLNSCRNSNPSDLLKEKLIPKPQSLTPTFEYFNLNKNTKIIIDSDLEYVLPVGNYLVNILKPATGFNLPIKNGNNFLARGHIYLSLNSTDTALGDEGYQLDISKTKLKLTAHKPAGLIRGIQTLRQLLPPGIEMDTIQAIEWNIATGTIRDFPRYKYRGVMLDVARHFFSVKDVKRYIDLISYYKINTLHLHLTDDQGWRIEIKTWPKLTAVGGSSSVKGESPGFYTQEDYTEIVNYAADRFITIIPEVDMPGHTNAALASYAELNANNIATNLYKGTRVGFSSLAIHKDITYEFIDDVIRELAAITPGPYIHIGGDESHATKHDDYIYFVKTVLKIVEKYNKVPIGWDEIANSEIIPNTVIQYWNNADNASLGISKGARVILSPSRFTYMDMKYDSTTFLGLDWSGTIEVDKAYNWLSDSLIKGIPEQNILGIEAPLWTETLISISDIEFLTFPRLPGYAEMGWSNQTVLNWDDYKLRLAAHKLKFEALGINYYKSEKVDW